MNNNGGSSDGNYGLETIGRDGSVPKTRMGSAAAVQAFALRLRQNDEKRSWKRARVAGLVGGNPPYKTSKLREAGMAGNCNVNWGTARMYLESASGAFYDLYSEAPGQISIRTTIGASDEEKSQNSTIMSEEADRVLAQDPAWDFEIQQSQDQMTLNGRGPLMFEDAFKVLPKAFHDADLKVPERTKADTTYWEVACIDGDYFPPEIYAFIANEKAAKLSGWDVEFTRQVISHAMEIRQPDNRLYDWEFYQQELKNNSLSYYDDSKVCHLVHVFWKEFNGRITHAIVEREATAESEPKYLFIRVGRYSSFQECIHPMYFDRGNGGFHHSVTGQGVKMYGPMEYENRLLCNLMDKAFAPKLLFRPTSAEAKQKFELATFGDYGVTPSGWDVQQVPIQGFLTDGLAMWRASSDLMRSNLANYRQQVAPDKPGNPITAREVTLKATEASSLSKPVFCRYYKQLDLLYTEIVRRLCRLDSTDKRALSYQERCMARGVPREAFGRVESVTAVRVIGQGNPFMRQQSVGQVGQVVQRLPEDGQQNWLNDYIACNAGQAAVGRYNPPRSVSKLPSEQEAEALQNVGLMKVGVVPVVTNSQNPVVFAATYLKSATAAMQSLQQGGNMMEVYGFLQIAGPAIAAHLQRFANDPLRSQVFQLLNEQWKKLSQLSDMLRDRISQQQQAAQAQQQKTQGAMSDSQIKAAKVAADIALKQKKQEATLAMQAERHKQQLEEQGQRTVQELSLKDATTASEIHRKNRMAESTATPPEE